MLAKFHKLPIEALDSGEIRDPLRELTLLPMFYLFPAELLLQSEFANFPRNPHVVYGTPKWRQAYHSDKFLETVVDGMGGMIWKHFGIKAPMEDHSGYYPFWILARYSDWFMFAREEGYSTVSLALAKPFTVFPVLSWEEAESVFSGFVARYRERNPLDEWLEVVRKHPAHEDYEPTRRRRRTYIDFLRKWHHIRAKWVKPVSVNTSEEWDKLDDKALLQDPYSATDARIDFNTFLENFSTKEQQIVFLLIEGFTQAEIAKAVGYANHSAVSKKVKKIANKYRDFIRSDDKKPDLAPAVQNNWWEMTQLLFPKAKPKPNT